jgi:hypothetical protein
LTHFIVAVPPLRTPPPPLYLTHSTFGTSHPPSSQHAACDFDKSSQLFLLQFPEECKAHRNRILGNPQHDPIGNPVLRYSTEFDLVLLVNVFLQDLIATGKFGFQLRSDLGIKSITPNICILTDGCRLIGVVEVKKPSVEASDTPPLLSDTVLGELLDQMLLLQGFYGSGPIIGILTTFEEWLFTWFPGDSSELAQPFERVPQASTFRTPMKSNIGAVGTPSQIHKVWQHGIQVDDDHTDPEEDIDQEKMERKLCVSPVIHTRTPESYALLLDYLYTSFCRMDRIKLNHTPSFVCSFILRKGEFPLSWSPHIPSLDKVARHSYPNPSNVKDLMALEDLGRGGTGKAWLMCTKSSPHSICVLKFRNEIGGLDKIREEQKWWSILYPEFITSVDLWSNSWGLMMPHFSPIHERNRTRTVIDSIHRLLLRFQTQGYIHPDVRWENIGMYQNLSGEDCPVLFDLCGIQKFEPDKHSNWISKAISDIQASNSLCPLTHSS